MAFLCPRCALNSHLRVARTSRLIGRRTISSTSRRQKHAIPTFTETSSPELDNVLQSMREKHFVPAAVSKPIRRMMFGEKHKQQLMENPQSIKIGSQEVELQWLDRRKDIPARRPLVKQALELMVTGERSDWNNLRGLLEGLHMAGATLKPDYMAMLIRMAAFCGCFEAIMDCLQHAKTTGMSMKDRSILDAVMWEVRCLPEPKAWIEPSIVKAMKTADRVAALLETEEHNLRKPGESTGDPTKSPVVIGVFLELAAIHAQRFRGMLDADGRVAAYAERLLSNIEPSTISQRNATSSRIEMMNGIPILHGLSLASEILKKDMPKKELSEQIISSYKKALRKCVWKMIKEPRTSKKRRAGNKPLPVAEPAYKNPNPAILEIFNSCKDSWDNPWDNKTI